MKKNYFLLLSLFFFVKVSNAQFIFKVETTTANETFVIPTKPGETYNYQVLYTKATGELPRFITSRGNTTLTFDNPGIHTVEINLVPGDFFNESFFPAMYFNKTGDKDKIVSIEKWGNNKWTTMENAFAGCSNLVINATDTPNLSLVTNMSFMFEGTTNLEDLKDKIGNWNIETVENLTGVFKDSGFNENINNWNVSNVRFMDSLFEGASNYNQPLNNWTTTSLEYANAVFREAINFNQPLKNWNMSLVKEIGQVFLFAESFSQDLSSWDISNVTEISQIFFGSKLNVADYDATILGWSTLSAGETAIPLNLEIANSSSMKYCDLEARLKLINDYNWSFTGDIHSCPEEDKFITTWKTNADGLSGNDRKKVTIPTDDSYDYHYSVDWGDGNVVSNYNGNATHTYATQGTYQIKIFGIFPAIKANVNTSKMILQIESVDQWGNMKWQTFKSAFDGCRNLDVFATDIPDLSNVTDMSFMFFECFNLGNAGTIDFSGWNTSNVTNMSRMFSYTNKLTGASIENWNVGKVTDFNNMFSSASVFNENLNNWNIGENVTGTIDMSAMFLGAGKFNSPLNNWDVSKVYDFIYSFRGALEFNQDLSSWDISSGTAFIGMLDATALTVENYDKTLQGFARLDAGETQIPTNIRFGALEVGYGNPEYRETLKNTYTWTFEGDIFAGIEEEKFITTWRVEAEDLTIPIYTFGGATYDYTIDWGDGIIESGVTGDTTHTYGTAGTYTVKIYEDFPQMYFFNRDGKEKLISIDQWGTQKWFNLDFAFYGCSNLELNADDIPDLSQATSIGAIFQNATAFTDAKDKLKDWDVSTIESFSFAFQGTTFNRDISGWNMQLAKEIDFMFADNQVFNQPVGNWTFNNLKTASAVFRNATSFNQNLSNWNVSQVDLFELMFENATAFNQSLANWDISEMRFINKMLDNSGMSVANYDETLFGWASLDAGETKIPTGMDFNSTSLQFCNGAYARNQLATAHSWTFTDGGQSCAEETKFITTWKTTSPNESIQVRTSGGTSIYTIEWGDGAVETDRGGNSSHTYATPGVYTVKISGAFARLYTNNFTNIGNKMQSVEQWGTGRWESFDRAFEGAGNVVINATDIPNLSSVTNMYEAFRDCRKLVDNGGQMKNWNVSTVENFTSTFQGATLFNENLGDWDISNMNSANNMLSGTAFSTSNYDKTVIGWATIQGGETIPQNINLGANGINYCVSGTERDLLASNGWNFTDAGQQCESQDAFITTWRTTIENEEIVYPGVTNGRTYNIDWGDGTLETGITGTISHTYLTSDDYQVKVTGDLTSFFINDSPNNDNLLSIDHWGSIRWMSLARAFNNCNNLVLKANDTPDLTSVTNMNLLFSHSTNFKDLGGRIGDWDVSNVEVMGYLFRGTAFNSNINNWDVRKAIFVGYMFANTTKFNQPLDKWKFESTNSLSLMFIGAEVFNQDLSSWDVSSIESFSSMFKNAKAFDQDLSNWDISSALNMTEMFKGVALSNENYDAILEGWSTLDNGETQVPVNVTFHAGDSKLCLATDAKSILESSPYNWIITDAGSDCENTVVWSGDTDINWTDADNWEENNVPSTTNNVVVQDVTNQPVINNGVIAEMNDLTIRTSAGLEISENGGVVVNGDLETEGVIEINSATNTSGTLVVKGETNGIVNFERSGLLANKWSLITVPVSGQSIKEFIENPANDIRENTTVTPNRYAVGYYDDSKPAGSKWTYYTEDEIVTNALTFEQGRSYIVSRSTDGSVIFTGTLETNDVIIPVNEDQWNAVGNPYTAYLPVNNNANINFIQENLDKFDPVNVAVYIWDNAQNKYVAKSLLDQNLSLTVGQGFFIKTNVGVSALDFKENQRLTDATGVQTFSRQQNVPTIKVVASQDNVFVDTNIKLMNSATKGLDAGYDIGNFGGANFDIFTRLVEDSTQKDFTIQSLPYSNEEEISIPLGIKSEANKEIEISVQLEAFPESSEVYLEDTETDKFIKLDHTNSYELKTTSAISGIGRFYIHLKPKTLDVAEETLTTENINIFKSDAQEITISGIASSETVAVKIFSVLGSEVFNTNIKGNPRIRIQPTSVETGIYIVQIEVQGKQINKKVVFEE